MSIADRAFAAGALRLAFASAPVDARSEVERAYVAARELSLRIRDDDRAEVARGVLRGARLRDAVRNVPGGQGDHWIEELLGIAHPPLDPEPLERELVHYVASGTSEMFDAFDRTGLGPGHVFVDYGSGLGKAVFLAALVTGARAVGIEIDGALSSVAETEGHALRVDRATFLQADARTVAMPEADVAYVYAAFTGRTFDLVLDRLRDAVPRRPVFVCAPTVDVTRHPWLQRVHGGTSWLDVHRARARSVP